MLRQMCMSYQENFAWGYRNGFYKISSGYDQCSDDAAVLEKVRADSGAIGFIQYRTKLPGYAKCLAVKVANGEPSIKPNLDAQMQSDYPLTEPLILLVHPSAPPSAKEFVQFAQGKDASRILTKHGFTTLYSQNEFQAEKRLAEMKLGKGVHLAMTGFLLEKDTAQALAMEYVKAKATVQLDFASAEAHTDAVGRFLGGGGGAAGKDLLLLSDRPSELAMKLYGQKWSDLNPHEYLVAGRAVAIVTNAANKLDFLTLDQIRSIFSGQVKEWNLLSAGSGTIHSFGLPSSDPACQVFYKEGLPAARVSSMTAKKNTAEVLKAVSMDPEAIGFVDVTAIPTTGQTIKILALRVGNGAQAKMIPPTPENIRTSTYPLSSRLYLYVHPKASDTAKDFARFLATCGGSAATPYADAINAMMETYQKQGVLPLADEAIQRMTQDTAEAKAEAGKPKAKGK